MKAPAWMREASRTLAWCFMLGCWALHWLPPLAFWVLVAVGCLATALAHHLD